MNKAVFDEFFNKGLLDVRSENYIWLPEMEFLSEESSQKRKGMWSEYLFIDEYVPFAINGGGDFYAWKGDDTVVFVEHDSGNGRIYAGSFMDALFRHIIEIAAGMYVDICSDEDKASMDEDDAEYYSSESEIIALIDKCEKCFGDRFNNEQNQCLRDLRGRGFSEEGILIDHDEMIRIIDKSNAYSNETIRFLK